MTKRPYPSGEGASECSAPGCCQIANPHNADGLCAACEEAEIERLRRLWASDGRVGLGITLGLMSTAREWLDEDE